MEIDVISEEKNPMLHRQDVQFEVVHEDASPSRLSVRDSLAAKLNKDASEVVVHAVDTKYGMRKSIGYAKVYDMPEQAQQIEQSYMLERNKIGVEEETDTDAETEEA
jgi:small subunit ribosomal protein S24e